MNTISKFYKQNLLIVFLSLTVILISACQNAGATTIEDLPTPIPTPAPSKAVVLGSVNEDVKESVKEIQPLADYLAANLAEFGISEGKVVVAPDLEKMAELLKNGEVDLFFESPYGATVVYNQAGAVPLLRRWKGGVKEYHSVIVVRQDSGVASPADLKGQTIAFEDPGSTTGYLMPKAYLLEQGYSLVEKSGSTPVASDQIGYVFAQSEENVMTMLLLGQVAATALNNLDYEDIPAEGRAELVVIGQSQSVPRHVALASLKTDKKLRQRLTELLLAMHETEEGRAVLEAFEETSQFDPFPEGAEAAMKALTKLFADQE
jgi:phosphonate transport system substrate-binding protein